jgi:prepilin-type processing-associated H-X9-DG protein
LLVVIGIVALLIALLLPSLGVARQQAQRVACEAKLHNMMIAALVHVSEHHGYYPLAGVLPGWQPADLDDPYSTHYSYMAFPTDPSDPLGPYSSPFVAPITISLAAEMSYKQVLQINSNNNLGVAETDPHGFIQNFLCPSQAASVSELTQVPDLYSGEKNVNINFSWGSISGGLSDVYWEQQSYNFNEAILGWADPYTPTGRLHGNAAQVRQPAKTMFAADGLMNGLLTPWADRIPYSLGNGMATFYNINPNPPVTLADAYLENGNAGDTENFDLIRHRGKINIAFCDGHVETRTISAADLQNVFLLAP